MKPRYTLVRESGSLTSASRENSPNHRNRTPSQHYRVDGYRVTSVTSNPVSRVKFLFARATKERLFTLFLLPFAAFCARLFFCASWEPHHRRLTVYSSRIFLKSATIESEKSFVDREINSSTGTKRLAKNVPLSHFNL